MMWRISVLVASLLVAGWCLAEAVPDTKVKTPSSAEQLQAQLSKQVTTPVIERNTTLRAALKVFAERFKVEVNVDARAFQNDFQAPDPREQSVELPALTGVSVRAALGKLAEQVDGVIIQEGNAVWLVPLTRKQRPLVQPIDVDYTDKDLEAALKELAARTGTNIVLDRKRAGEAVKQPITVKLSGVELTNAVQVIADLSGLESVMINDVFYVTTAANAERLRSVIQPAVVDESRPQPFPIRPRGPMPMAVPPPFNPDGTSSN